MPLTLCRGTRHRGRRVRLPGLDFDKCRRNASGEPDADADGGEGRMMDPGDDHLAGVADQAILPAVGIR